MLQYTIHAAEQSELKKVIVAGDYAPEEVYPLIHEAKTQYVVRDEENCRGELPATVVIDYLFKNGIVHWDDTICLLQPTSPLRNYKHINTAILLYATGYRQTLVSVAKDVPAKKLYYKNSTKYINDYTSFSKEKDVNLYARNSAIYIFPAKLYLMGDSIFEHRPTLYIMDSWDSIDVDDMEDMKHAEYIIRGLGNGNSNCDNSDGCFAY
jgi:CMP-N-acetylneuraminic acid synthetase